jgi:hypothetical protein
MFVFHRRYYVLPALSLADGILHVEIVEGSFNSDLFKIFIDRLLLKMQPFPEPNSVIVMDNCRIHKHPDILAAIEEQYAPHLSHTTSSSSHATEASVANSFRRTLPISTQLSLRSPL